MPRLRARVPQGAFSVLLLAVAFVSMVLLARQAYDAARSHRLASQAVLRDYAGLAAAELIRRAANEVGYQGHYVLVQALARKGASFRTLASDADEPTRRAARLVRRAFSGDRVARRVTFEDGGEEAAAAWLATQLDGVPQSSAFAVLQGTLANEDRMFVLI